MASQGLAYFLLLIAFSTTTVQCNLEVNVLSAWKATLDDPNKVLQSWDPTLVNPCTWFHITCNIENSVTRVDLGNAGLRGPLVPQLGSLTNLQYLEVFNNSITGMIPHAIGNLTNLISLDLFNNQLSGSIPASLGNLKTLMFLTLNSNKLSGVLPAEVIHLISYGQLRVLNVANNSLFGTIHPTNSTEFAVTTIIQDPRADSK